jgi:hypothetical protein
MIACSGGKVVWSEWWDGMKNNKDFMAQPLHHTRQWGSQ